MNDVPAGWYPHPHQLGAELYWDGSAWTGQTRPAAAASLAAKPATAPPVASRPARPRAAWLVATLTPILVVALVGAVLILGHTSNAQAAVARALSSTLAQRTADVSISGSAKVGGDTVPISGSGAFNFTQNDGTMSVSISIIGHQLNEKTIYSDQSIYLNLGPSISQVLPGKSWISLDLSQLSSESGSSKLGSGGLDTNDPGAILNILGEGGNTVTALGASTINGVSVQGYSVKVNPAAIQKELNNPNLPEWLRQAASSVSNPNVDYTVFIGDSGMVYRLTTDESEQVSGQALDESVSMDFSNFGTAVDVTVPPASQVGSFQDFLNAAKALQSRTVS